MTAWAGIRRAWQRHKAREAVEKLQRERPDELFPGANGTGDVLPCGHEQQADRPGQHPPHTGGFWYATEAQRIDREPSQALRCRPDAAHQGRCLGCQHCGAFTAKHTRLW